MRACSEIEAHFFGTSWDVHFWGKFPRFRYFWSKKNYLHFFLSIFEHPTTVYCALYPPNDLTNDAKLTLIRYAKLMVKLNFNFVPPKKCRKMYFFQLFLKINVTLHLVNKISTKTRPKRRNCISQLQQQSKPVSSESKRFI